MYLCTNDVHVPRYPHDRFRNKNAMGLRGDAIVQFDYTVGQIYQTLEKLGLAENTLLVITSDYRFLLPRYENEVELSPINKALYIFFLNHEEGVEFKCLSDYREELIALYRKVGNRVSDDIICESIERLVNPLDNSINEKCARIKSAFAKCMDSYQLNYYAISKHSVRQVEGSNRIWYDRRRTITLPRELVQMAL